MTGVELLAIGVVFLIGVVTGVIALVSLASHREDRRTRLSREAPDGMTHAGRLLTNLYVRRPGDDECADGSPDGRYTETPSAW
jgi:hypothetical protein